MPRKPRATRAMAQVARAPIAQPDSLTLFGSAVLSEIGLDREAQEALARRAVEVASDSMNAVAVSRMAVSDGRDVGSHVETFEDPDHATRLRGADMVNRLLSLNPAKDKGERSGGGERLVIVIQQPPSSSPAPQPVIITQVPGNAGD